jgi:hypothetical protein
MGGWGPICRAFIAMMDLPPLSQHEWQLAVDLGRGRGGCGVGGGVLV